MNSSHKILSLTAMAILAVFTINTFGEEKEETVTLNQIPQKVKDTLKKYAADSEVKKVEKGDQDGKKVFDFDIEQGTNKFEVAISAKGKYMGREEDVELSTLPEAIQKALNDQAAGGTLSGCEKAVDRHGKISYEADITKDGKKSEVAVDETGKVINHESGEDKD